MLSREDTSYILGEFPNVKLSYENIVYKKVYNFDYLVAIPQGKKCFAWFTYFKEKPVCLIMELANNKKISNINLVSACFSSELAYGTILYGTLLYNSNNRFFYIEDIFSYKGTSFDKMNWGNKLTNIHSMLKNDLKQLAYNNSFVVFGLPIVCKNFQELDEKVKTIHYTIDIISFNLFTKYNCYLCMTYQKYIQPHTVQNGNISHSSNNNSIISIQPTQKYTEYKKYDKNIHVNRNNIEFVFIVRPDVENDIYYLYCLNSECNEEKHSICHIPDFNTSVMMNKLFRNIKENTNLDTLEESDDEEDFENENENKFVDLNKSYKMTCQFNHKFKKWTPIKVSEERGSIICSSKALQDFYKNNIYRRNIYA